MKILLKFQGTTSFKKFYDDGSNSVHKVNGCRKNVLIATCQVLHDVHDEYVHCPQQEKVDTCYKALVIKVKTRLTEVVKNVKEGSKCSRKRMEPIATACRIILKQSDMKILSDLGIFSGYVISAVPVCLMPRLLNFSGFLNYRFSIFSGERSSFK